MDRISLRASGDDALSLDVADSTAESIDVVGVSVERGGNLASFVFAEPLRGVSRNLFLPEGSVDAGVRPRAVALKGVDALVRAGEDLAREGRREALETLRDALRRLRRIEAEVDLAAEGFLGVRGFAGAGMARARLVLDLTPLLPDGAFSKSAPGDVTLVATMQAAVDATFGGNRANVAVRSEVRLTAGFALDCDVAVDLPHLPDLPPLSVRLPRFSLPNLRFGVLAIPPSTASDYIGLRLRVPGLGIVCDDPKPAFSLGVDGAGALTIQTTQAASGRLQLGGRDVATFTGVALALGGGPVLSGRISADDRQSHAIPPPDPAGLPFTITFDEPCMATLAAVGKVDLETDVGDFRLTTSFEMRRATLRTRADPSLSLSLRATYLIEAGSEDGIPRGRLSDLALLAPDPLTLVAEAGRPLADVWRALAALPLPGAGAPGGDPGAALRNVARFLTACARWLAQETSGAGRALATLAEDALGLLERFVAGLADAASDVMRHVVVDVRLDAETFALRQVIVTPRLADVGTGTPLVARVAGFRLEAPGRWRPSLLLDLSGVPLVALCMTPDAEGLSLSTDLWLDGTEGARAARTRSDGVDANDDPPLLKVTATRVSDCVIALASIEGGEAKFFRRFVQGKETEQGAVGPGVSILLIRDRPSLASIRGEDLTVEVTLNKGKAKRLLPFLSGPSPLSGALPQAIEIATDGPPARVKDGAFALDLKAKLRVAGAELKTTLTVSLALETLTAKLSGGDVVIVGGADWQRFLGMAMRIVPKAGVPPAPKPGDPVPTYAQWRLSFADGDASLRLHGDARAEFTYSRLASSGRGLVFHADEISVSRNGLDLDAAVDPGSPVVLAGIDESFQFTQGHLVIRRGVLQTMRIAGAGALPPALVGEAKANVAISLAQRDGRIYVESAEAELDLSGKPLECKSTRFAFQIVRLGLAFEDFGERGTHFYFQITGSARFKPIGAEFAGGLLGNLDKIEIALDKAPLAADARLLAERVSFQVAMSPPKRARLFEVFEFELRGFGFRPASPAFDGKPAICLSGQISFLKSGDTPSPRFDFHDLWIAPPKSGEALPQVRCDGLGVSLGLGGAGSIEGTAIAVDDKLPSMNKPLAPGITARGFLATGRVAITGWAPMAAAMGFLELRDDSASQPRHAFFVYAQANRLAARIPIPFFELWLREVGFGLGFRYTLAALEEADTVSTPTELIRVLDRLAKTQGELASVAAWQPEASGDRLTLAMRAMFSMACVSRHGQLSPEEGSLPNPVLFDVTAALRSDLTLMMTVRAWLCVNYARWDAGSTTDELRRRPSLTGYLYLSAPKQMLLARMRSNRDGIVGDTPPMFPALKRMFEAVDWSSTLYVAPGVYHHEMGWPYELGFELRDDSGNFGVSCHGGCVLRVEDGAVLHGIAFRAVGFAKFGGSVGGGSLGASVQGRADFEITAKLIAYLSLKRFSDTLFYGFLDFVVTLRFTARVWLEFSIGFRDIHIEAGFSATLCVSVALELAATPEVLAGRGRAQLAVSALGCTLRLGVGFGFNEGALAEARARVDRFLALGLERTVPDPERGLSQPPLSQAPAEATRAADARGDHAMCVADKLGPTPAPDAPPPAGPPASDPVVAPAFWALLRPVPGRKGAYVVTLIPRDATASAGATVTVPGFYAPPLADAAYRVDFAGAAPPALRRLRASNVEPVVPGIPFAPAYSEVAAIDGDARLTIGDVVAQCYVSRRKPDGSWDILGQPRHRAIDASKAPDADGESAKAALRAAAEQASLGDADERAWRAIEERRSSVLAAIHDSQRALADQLTFDERGEPVSPPRATPLPGGAPVIDARDFGLTFFVDEAELPALFAMGTAETQPPQAAFDVVTRVASGDFPAVDRSVALFNPPIRFFEAQDPTLAAASCRFGADAIELDWDLEPAWGSSADLYGDPEFHLAHYRISGVARTFNSANAERLDVLQKAPVTVRAAAPLSFSPDDGGWARLRPRAQFADRLEGADLAAVRAAVLRGDWTGLVVGGAPATAVEIEYTVIAVDVAGTESTPRRIAGRVGRPRPVVAPPQRAEILFDYAAMPKDGQVFATPAQGRPSFMVLLRIGDGGPPADGQRFLLRLRRTVGVAAGRYGADALDEALTRPTPADFTRSTKEDTDVVVVMRRGAGPVEDRLWPIVDRALVLRAPWSDRSEPCLVLEAGALDDLRTALGVPCRPGAAPARAPRATRVAVSRLTARVDERSPFVVADLALRIAGSERDGSRSVEVAVEAFEHPIALTFEPLHFEDIGGGSGRALALHPAPTGSLGDYVRGIAEAGVWTRDKARRVGTRLWWNSRPFDGSPSKGLDRPGMIGGFDVFAIDLANLSKGSQPADAARRVARVQALPARMRAIDPAAIDDYGALECLYPSLTARLEGGAEQGSGLAPWFSTAESLLVWPQFVLRRSLGLDVEEAALSPLFGQRTPTAFRLSLTDWPQALRAPPGLALLPVMGLDPPAASTEDGALTVPVAGSPMTALRKILCMLVLVPGQPADAQGPLPWRDYEARSAELGRVRLRIEARRDEHAVANVLLLLDLMPELHPFVADVVNRLRWSDPQAPHRRFVPVLDGAPATKAKTFAELAVERGETRDPAGWAVLRSLGLAVGVRLFDMERCEYCPADEARRLLAAAMGDVLPRYADVTLGAPFADLMWSSGGLVALQSNDGDGPSSEGERVEGQALTMAQIALRPVAEALAGATSPISYVVVTGGQLTLDMNRLDGRACVAIEAIDLTRGTGSPKPLALTRLGDVTAAALCPSGVPDGCSIATLAGADPTRPALMLRVVALFRDGAQEPIESLVSKALGENGTVSIVDRPRALDATSPAEPFGAFAPLAPATLDAIVEGVGDAAPHGEARTRFEAFKSAAGRFGDRSWWPDHLTGGERPARRTELATLYLGLVPRFLALGPAVAASGATGPSVSLTMLPASEPWRVAPAPDGLMDVLFLHDDRYARRHRYVVRPFGRYEHLDAASQGRVDGTADIGMDELGPWDDAFLEEHGVDVVVARSHPVDPPAVLAAGPVALSAPGGVQRGLEVVLAHHGEEVHQQANSRFADRLDFRFVAVAPMRSFTQAAWVDRLYAVVAPGERPDLLPAFGDGALPQSLPGLSVHSGSFDQAAGLGEVGASSLTRRLPDGWRGIRAIRLREAMPHGTAVHALAYAAAGVVVSDPVAATLGEGDYRTQVRMPWSAGAIDPVALRPSWDVDGGGVVVTAPQVRLVDGVRETALDAWALRTNRPAIFDVPDGTVVYALTLARGGILPGALDVTGASETSLEAEWVPKIDDADVIYETRAPGPRFSPGRTSVTRAPWRIRAELRRKAVGVSLDVARPEAPGGGEPDWQGFRAEVKRVRDLIAAAGALAPAAQLAGFEKVGDDAAFEVARRGLGPFDLVAGTPLFGPTAPAGPSKLVTLPVGGGFYWGTPLAAERAPDPKTFFEATTVPLSAAAATTEERFSAAGLTSVGLLLHVRISILRPDPQAARALLDALAAVSGVNGLNRRGAAEAAETLAGVLVSVDPATVTVAMPASVLRSAPVANALSALSAEVASEPLALLLHEPPSAAELAVVDGIDGRLGGAVREAALDQVWGAGRRPVWSAFQGAVTPAHVHLERAT